MKNFLYLLVLTFLVFSISCKNNPTSSPNTAPTASFTINPTTGTTTTFFTFDASGSTDNEDATSALQVRWDWENDGVWDTDYRSEKTITHYYLQSGTYTVNLEVKDSGALVNSSIGQLTVSTIYSGETGTMTDIDGNIYKTIKIGEQWWMAENLKVTRYRDGTPIPHIIDKTQWFNHHIAAYCSYNNDDYNHSIYGKLYNWYAIDDPRGLAPDGWHMPNEEEWKQLEMFLGMSQSDADKQGYRGKYEGGKLKEIGTLLWEIPNTGATNETGFSALPGGCRDKDGNFLFMGQKAYFWMSIEWYSGDDYWNNSELSYSSSGIGRSEYTGRGGFSVRCIKD